MLAAVILSGGASERMGSPKALLPFQGRPFLEPLLEITKHPSIGVRRVVLGAQAEPITREVLLAADEIVINKDWEQGQLSSIQAALRSLPAGTEGMLVCLVDHPLVTAGLVSELIEKFQATHAPIVLPVYEGRRGHPVIFSAGVLEELFKAPPGKRAPPVVWAYAAEVGGGCTDEEGCVLNLHYPGSMQRATGRLG